MFKKSKRGNKLIYFGLFSILISINCNAQSTKPTIFKNGISASTSIINGSGVSQGTVGETATTAAGAVQANGGDASKTVVTPTGDTASHALSDVAAQATGSVQKTSIGAANGVAPLDDNENITNPTSGEIQNGQISGNVTLYKTINVSICPSSPYVGGGRFGAGYQPGMRILAPDGSVVVVDTVADYSYVDSSGNTVNMKNGISTLHLEWGAYNTTDKNGESKWTTWNEQLDNPWNNSYYQPVTAFACLSVTKTQPAPQSLQNRLSVVSNLNNNYFDPRLAGVLFDGSTSDGENIQNYFNTYHPQFFKVQGEWPANFVLDKSNINSSVFVDSTAVTGTTMYNSGVSDGDTYMSYYNGILDYQRTDNTLPVGGSPVVQIRRILNTPNQVGYYASGEYQDTNIFSVFGNDIGTTGQLQGVNIRIDNDISKGFPAEEQILAGGGTSYGKAGHWIWNGGFNDMTHEPAGQSSWEQTGFEINMQGSGLDCDRCIYNPVDHAGRQIFVNEVSNNPTPAWTASTSYTAKYAYYGVGCQAPGLTNSCIKYNPDKSSHVSGIVTTNTVYNLTGENVYNSWNTVWLKEQLNLNSDYDTVTISGDGVPAQKIKSWTNAGEGVVLNLSTPTSSNNSNASLVVTVTHKIPYIFRAVAPNGGDLTTSKADYNSTSATTEPDWASHLDGKVFAEQTDSNGNAIPGSTWWQLASEDAYGIGSALSLTRHPRQFYDVGIGSNATFEDAALDLSGSLYRNTDGKSAQIRLNDRVPAIDFTAAMDSDESITGSGLSGEGPEQYKNLHTLGYDGSISSLSYKVKGKDILHVDDDGNIFTQGMLFLGTKSKSAILAISSPLEGQTVYDIDDHAEVTYRCPTTSTCGWFPVQYGTALSN